MTACEAVHVQSHVTAGRRRLDEGVGAIVWSPLARGRLARAWDDARSTARSDTDGDYADLLYSRAGEASNRRIIDAVGTVAEQHGVSRASIALAWLQRQPVVTAPLVGAGSTQQIDDAIASLDVKLTDEPRRTRRGTTGRAYPTRPLWMRSAPAFTA
jgi:aryl-alcohol dehydrogenase-like predicted oxidoreductase